MPTTPQFATPAQAHNNIQNSHHTPPHPPRPHLRQWLRDVALPLDQLKLVARWVLHKCNHGAAALDGARLTRNLAACKGQRQRQWA
jgi:hypothetical protein